MRILSFRNLASIAFAAFVANSAQAMTVNPGDLLMSFYQISPSGTSVDANTYVYNLGAASTYRESTSTTTLIANINQDLVEQFGVGWAEDPNLRICITGVVGSGDSLTNGDPSRTLYYSRGISPFTLGQIPAWSLSATQRGTTTTQVKTFADAMNGKPSTATQANGAAVASSANSSVTSFLPPIQTTNFGLSIPPTAAFEVGTIGAATGYNVEAALDVFRILHSTSLADLTVNKTLGNAATGTAVYIGTFTVATNGAIRYDIPPAPVTQSPYQTWATQNSLSGGNAAGNADPDKDGMANGIEFLVGGNPNVADVATKGPVVAKVGNQLSFSFRRTDASVSITPTVEHDTDLIGVWTPAANGANGVVMSVQTDFFDATTDRVTYLIPNNGVKNFARLRMVIP